MASEKKRNNGWSPEDAFKHTILFAWAYFLAGLGMAVFGSAYLPGVEIPWGESVLTVKPYLLLGLWLVTYGYYLMRSVGRPPKGTRRKNSQKTSL